MGLMLISRDALQILKTSTKAASALNELEAATTVNEVGSAYHVEDQPQSQHQSFRQSLGDKVMGL